MCVEYYAQRLNIKCLLLKLGHNYCIAGNFHPRNCSIIVWCTVLVGLSVCIREKCGKDHLSVKIEPP